MVIRRERPADADALCAVLRADRRPRRLEAWDGTLRGTFGSAPVFDRL